MSLKLDPSRPYDKLPPSSSTRRTPSQAYLKGFLLKYCGESDVYWTCAQDNADGSACRFLLRKQQSTSPSLYHLKTHAPTASAKRPLTHAYDPDYTHPPPSTPASARAALIRSLAEFALTGGVSLRGVGSTQMTAILHASAACGPAGLRGLCTSAKVVAQEAEGLALKELHDLANSFGGMPTALTYDAWSLRGHKFLAVTATALTPDFVLQRGVLAFLHDLPDHSGTAIAAAITPLIRPLGPVFAATTDGAPNMRASARELGIHHVPCVMHHAGLALSALLLALGDTWKRTRRTLAWLHLSPKAMAKLRGAAKEKGREVTRAPSWVLTRPLSVAPCLAFIIKNADEILRLSADGTATTEEARPCLQGDDCAVLSSVQELVTRVTTQVARMEAVGAHLGHSLPLLKQWASYASHDNAALSAFGRRAEAALHGAPAVLLAATFLTPAAYGTLSADERDRARNFLHHIPVAEPTCVAKPAPAFSWGTPPHPPPVDTPAGSPIRSGPAPPQSPPATDPPPDAPIVSGGSGSTPRGGGGKSRGGGGKSRGGGGGGAVPGGSRRGGPAPDPPALQPRAPLDASLELELNQYASLVAAHRESEECAAWRTLRASLPRLAERARKVLAVQPTEADSERAFKAPPTPPSDS